MSQPSDGTFKRASFIKQLPVIVLQQLSVLSSTLGLVIDPMAKPLEGPLKNIFSAALFDASGKPTEDFIVAAKRVRPSIKAASDILSSRSEEKLSIEEFQRALEEAKTWLPKPTADETVPEEAKSMRKAIDGALKTLKHAQTSRIAASNEATMPSRQSR